MIVHWFLYPTLMLKRNFFFCLLRRLHLGRWDIWNTCRANLSQFLPLISSDFSLHSAQYQIANKAQYFSKKLFYITIMVKMIGFRFPPNPLNRFTPATNCSSHRSFRKFTNQATNFWYNHLICRLKTDDTSLLVILFQSKKKRMYKNLADRVFYMWKCRNFCVRSHFLLWKLPKSHFYQF